MTLHKSSHFLIVTTAFMARIATALVPPVQTYFIPLPEYQLFNETFAAVNADRAKWPIESSISIAIAADDTIIYYDHWEDGYEFDVTNPTQTTTEIWGDGDISNGGRPGATTDAEDILIGGTSYVLNSAIPENYENDNFPPFKIDGSDRVQASLPIAMTRTAFPSSPGALMAGAVEVFNTASWGNNFVSPIGINTGSETLGHESVVTYIMAGQNKTEVKRNGNFIATLDAGESFVVKDTILGDSFTSNKAIQVDILAGDVSSRYELRWLAQIPREKWGNTYLSPVGENTGPTAYVIYNPNPTLLEVQYDGAGFSCPEPPCKTTVQSKDDLVLVINRDIILSGDYTGIKFSASDDFYVYAEVDADGTGNLFDWGFPLIPIDQTSSLVLVGDGRGCRTPSCDLQSQNQGFARSPLWVTCEEDCDIKLYLNGVGKPPHEALFDIPKLSSTRFYPDNSPNDYTGAIIEARKTGTQDPTNIAVAWGQDPRRSYWNDNDGLDLGTAIIPLENPFVAKSVVNITNPDGSLDSDNIVDQVGDTINYKVTITNVGFGDIEIDQVFDSLLNQNLAHSTLRADRKLLPKQTRVYDFSYVVNADDIQQKAIKNTVTVRTTDFPPVSDDENVDVKLVSISGYVFEDIDENDTGDVGISGVTIKLYNAENELRSTITDKDGYYEFADLEAGDYTIVESPASGYIAVSDVGDPYESTIMVNKLKVSLNGESDLTKQNFIDERISAAPSKNPSSSPSSRPSLRPSATPSAFPTRFPSIEPTFSPTSSPTYAPTSAPTSLPSTKASSTPTWVPTDIPSTLPTNKPTNAKNSGAKGEDSSPPSSAPSSIIRTSPPIPTPKFCEVVSDENCSLCAPYRSPDYCPSNQSFSSLIKIRTKDHRTNISKVFNDGYWFPYLEDKVAGYRLTVENGFPAPRIFCCETDFKGIVDCLNNKIPPNVDGIVVKTATLHSSQGVYVLLNDTQSDNSFFELLTEVPMTYDDVLAGLDFVNATKIIVEEFIGSKLPMEYKFHVTGGEVQAVDVIANRGADCQCYAVVDTDWTRLDQFGCFEPADVGFRQDKDNEKCTAINFDSGRKNIGPVKKDMYLCDDVTRIDDYLWEEMERIALELGESIGVSIRVDMFVADDQIYVQEYATNHMNGLRHCAAKLDENDCVDSCFLGRAWEEAGGTYGGVSTEVPPSLKDYHLKSTSEMCDLVGVTSTYVQKSRRRRTERM